MMFYVLLLALLVGVLLWLGQWLLAHPGTATITWSVGEKIQVMEMKTFTLVFGLMAACMAFYLLLILLRHLFSLRRSLRRMQESRLSSKASRALTQGLIQLTEGHWEKGEKLLADNAQYSETPLLNYLAAARAAHMQEAYGRRDDWLRQAIESDSKANVAVGVSQAEMQLGASQIEQAHATLTRLRELAPRHPYVLKLLAKVLHRQENWESLLDILPELVRQNLLKSEDMSRVQAETLNAMFQSYVRKRQPERLQAVWKKLPAAIREYPEAILLYAQALHQVGDESGSATLVQTNLNRQWHDGLADLYGNIRHPNPGAAIQQAEKWQTQQPNNPIILLVLARLYQQQRLWGMAKTCYEASLNQAPNAAAYLELAELLETMKEPENAQRCYRLGLRYAIRQEGEKLVLSPTQRPQAGNPQMPALTPYNGL